jgi:hypothetical protein
MELTDKDKIMLERFRKATAEYSSSIGLPPKKRYFIHNMPRKYKLNEQEKKEIPAKYEEFIKIQDDAINLVKKNIKRLEDEDSVKHEWIIYKLKKGLEVLEGGKQAVIERGVLGLIGWLERVQRGRRSGFGLWRGFGEFLNALPYSKEPWTDEIMDAVDKIESYFNAM